MIDLRDQIFARRIQALAGRRLWRRTGRRHEARAVASLTLRNKLRELRALAVTGMGASAYTVGALLGAGVLLWVTQTVPQTVYDLLGVRQGESVGPVRELIRWLSQSAPAGFSAQSLLAAALSVTGTFAGLYFATVTFVVSSTYKDSTARVRDLVTRQPSGRLYSFIYVQAVLFGLIALALPMAGHTLTRMSMCTLAFFAALVALSFFRLRQQLFRLLEPAALIHAVETELEHHLHRATRLAKRDSPAPAAVTASRERTRGALLTLRDLGGLVLDRERSAKGDVGDLATADPRVAETVRRVQGVWRSYADRKQDLVRLAQWSPATQRNQDWLLAPEADVSTAMSSSTGLPVLTSPDDLWFERVLAGTVSELLHGRDARTLAAILHGHEPLPYLLAATGQLDEARLWFDTVAGDATRAAIAEASGNHGAHAAADNSSQRVATDVAGYDLADHDVNAEFGDLPATVAPRSRSRSVTEAAVQDLVDAIGRTHVQLVLGMTAHVQAVTADVDSWTVERVLASRHRPLGKRASTTLHELRDAVEFELHGEGHTVTTDGDVAHFVARAVGGEVLAQLEALQASLENDFWPWARSTAAAGTSAFGAALNRVAEATTRWDELLDATDRLFARCEVSRRNTDDKWPKLDLAPARQRRQDLDAKLAAPVARLAATISPAVTPDRPDLFGWAFHRAFKDLLDDVLDPDLVAPGDAITRINHLIAATNTASRRFRTSVGPNHPTVTNSAAAEPYLMLFQLSGAAMVLAEVSDRPELFTPYASVWHSMMSTPESARSTLALATACIAADHQLFGITGRKILRTEFELRIKAALSPYGIRSGMFGSLEEPWDYFESARRKRGATNGPVDSASADPADARPPTTESGNAATAPALSATGRKYMRAISMGAGSHFEELFVAAFLVPYATSKGASIDATPLRFAEMIEDFAGGDLP